MWWQVGVFKLFMRPLLWTLGLTTIEHRYLRISDVIASYKPVRQLKGPAPIVVSNHASWLDMFFYLSLDVSFLSKAAVASTPYVGMYAVARQCIFLDRESEADRSRVLELIKNRTDRVTSHGDLSPLLIFPEGTVTNGRSLMSFKRGAFSTGDHIKICVLRYNPEPLSFVWSIANMDALLSVIIGMSQWANSLHFIQFEDAFDPHWLYQAGLDPAAEESWQTVAQTVKNLMAFAGGLHQTDTTARQLTELGKASKAYNESLLSSSYQNPIPQ